VHVVMKSWFTRCYSWISDPDISGSIDIKSISVGRVNRRTNSDSTENGIHTIIHVYVRSWTVHNSQVTNPKIIACIETNHLHHSQLFNYSIWIWKMNVKEKEIMRKESVE